MPNLEFAMRGKGFAEPLGRVRQLPYLSVTKLREYCCRSRLNLVITRQAHASVYASSTARPFELAALGATMISNPYAGIEEWFEPGKEVVVVASAEEAVERYRWLIDHERERRAIGERARQRLLAEHTFAHRAQQLVRILEGTA
jgi:spore maturation protein CgeB